MPELDPEVAAELKSLTAMAKRLKLTGRKAEQYIREHMEQLGYVAHTTVSYSRKEEKSGGGGFLGGIFGGGGGGEDDDL